MLQLVKRALLIIILHWCKVNQVVDGNWCAWWQVTYHLLEGALLIIILHYCKVNQVVGGRWVECLVSLVAGGIPLTKTPVQNPLYFWIVSVQRWHDRCVFTISHSKYICFCNFVILSFKWEKKRGDEVEVGKLLIVNYINRISKNMSLAKHCFSEFSLFLK